MIILNADSYMKNDSKTFFINKVFGADEYFSTYSQFSFHVYSMHTEETWKLNCECRWWKPSWNRFKYMNDFACMIICRHSCIIYIRYLWTTRYHLLYSFQFIHSTGWNDIISIQIKSIVKYRIHWTRMMNTYCNFKFPENVWYCIA